MIRKRVVLILVFSIMLAIPLVLGLTNRFESTSKISPTDWSSYTDHHLRVHGQCTPAPTCHAVLAQDNFTINCPPESITWYRDSKISMIVWTITSSTLDTILFDVLRNGTVEYSGIAENYSFLKNIPVFYSVPISKMDFGTYNYTLVIMDGMETKSATVILNLIEGTANAVNPLLDAFVFVVLIGGFTVLSLATFLGLSSLNRYFGGMKSIEA
jgi:hypothetical protein